MGGAGSTSSSAFITHEGTDFILDDEPFHFVGANIYNAAGDPNTYNCGPQLQNPDEELDDWFSRFKGDSGSQVIRFWAYQSYTKGGTDWRALDRVVRLAKEHGLKVIPVLENQWPECSEGGYKYDSWYSGDYLKPYGAYPLSYKDYVGHVVERYKDEPTVAAWMLMNEAESKTNSGGEENPDALYTFAQDMSAYVKDLDENHLVTLGTIGSGQPGVGGSNYEHLYSLPTLDFAEFHDYGPNDEAMPGASSVPVAPLHTSVFTQDHDWNWKEQDYRQNKARMWETWTAEVPSGAQPFERIGLKFVGGPVEDTYIDQVQIGAKVFDFEDETTQGWQSDAPVTLENTSDVAYEGSQSLRLTFSERTEGTQVWIPSLPDSGPGTSVTVRVYVDTAGSIEESNSLATAMRKSKELNKPIIVGEAGMTTCGSYNGSQPETPDSRAQKFDAKMGAFFENGGAGYLIWMWHPSSDCSYDFTSGDPLNAVLAKYAATF